MGGARETQRVSDPGKANGPDHSGPFELPADQVISPCPFWLAQVSAPVPEPLPAAGVAGAAAL